MPFNKPAPQRQQYSPLSKALVVLLSSSALAVSAQAESNFTVEQYQTPTQAASVPTPAPVSAPAPRAPTTAISAPGTTIAPAKASNAPAIHIQTSNAAPATSAQHTTQIDAPSAALSPAPTNNTVGTMNLSAGSAKSVNTSNSTQVIDPNASNKQSFGFEQTTTNAESTSETAEKDASQEIEVSIPLTSTVDQAIVEAFKSLENSITLGMGTSSAKITVDEIAPAIRGIKFDNNNNAVLRFNQALAENILKKEGSTAWAGLSNPVLVWMVGLDESNNQDKLTLVSGQNLSSFAQAILQAAPEYKYRLMFPILDLEEIQKVQVKTVLDHQDQVLAEASARYGADYFIAAVINNIPNESGVSLKWNLYTKNGVPIANSSLSGVMDEVAALGAGDIARALMNYQQSNKQTDEPSQIKVNNVDIDVLGPGEGFIRLKMANVRNLEDIVKIRKAFVSYGFDGNVRVVGFDQGNVVLEISTNSDPVNLEATMRHAGDFTYISPWVFSFKSDSAARAPMNTMVGTASPNRPNSRIDPNKVAPNRVVVRDDRDVGQGAGLPNRNAPAIQGAPLD